MISKKEFKSQICTTREQSEQLLAVGLRPETADMVYHYTNSRSEFMQWELKTKAPTLRGEFWTPERIARLARGEESGENVFDKLWGKDIPAWSLSRLMEMLPESISMPNRPCADLEIAINENKWLIQYAELGYCHYHSCKEGSLFQAVVEMTIRLIAYGQYNKELLLQTKKGE